WTSSSTISGGSATAGRCATWWTSGSATRRTGPWIQRTGQVGGHGRSKRPATSSCCAKMTRSSRGWRASHPSRSRYMCSWLLPTYRQRDEAEHSDVELVSPVEIPSGERDVAEGHRPALVGVVEVLLENRERWPVADTRRHRMHRRRSTPRSSSRR